VIPRIESPGCFRIIAWPDHPPWKLKGKERREGEWEGGRKGVSELMLHEIMTAWLKPPSLEAYSSLPPLPPSLPPYRKPLVSSNCTASVTSAPF